MNGLAIVLTNPPAHPHSRAQAGNQRVLQPLNPPGAWGLQMFKFR